MSSPSVQSDHEPLVVQWDARFFHWKRHSRVVPVFAKTIEDFHWPTVNRVVRVVGWKTNKHERRKNRCLS